jgi:hypothetical protein
MDDQQLRLADTQAQREDVAAVEHESLWLRSVFCLALVLEIALVVVGLLCWRLGVSPW